MRAASRRALVGLGALLLLGSIAPGGASASPEQMANDPGLPRQWGLERIGAPSAWRISRGAGVVIAIVDSGVDRDHPDLQGRIVGMADCVLHDDQATGCIDGAGIDDAGHGTHVAGIAAATADNGQGVAGVAPQAGILSVKVLANPCTEPATDDCGTEDRRAEGSEGDVADGVRWAADHGADVINLSLGSISQAVLGPGQTFRDSLDYAWSQGAIPVLVAGNDLLLPGSLTDVPAVIVAATDRNDNQASYSNGVGNVRWAISAPGGEADSKETCIGATPAGIMSTYYVPVGYPEPEGGRSSYACLAGTSMAAPHVSGALAILRGAGLSPQQAVDRLLASADDLGVPGRDNTYGSGRLNLTRAVEGMTPAGNGGPVDAGTPTAPVGTLPPPVAVRTPLDETTTTAPSLTATTGETAPPITGPVTTELAGGGLPITDEDNLLPAGPLTAAVGLLVISFGGHAWNYLQGAAWARRTPR